MNIDPRGLTPRRWCDQMVIELQHFGQVPALQDEAHWQEWVEQISGFQGLEDTPDPSGFEQFEEWAMAFNLAVPL